MSIEDKQNHARRAFEKAMAERSRSPEQARPEARHPKPPAMTLTPSRNLRRLGDQEAARQMEKDRSSRSRNAEDAIVKAKENLATRSVKKEFNRAR